MSDAINEALKVAKSCPFCGSNKLDISNKGKHISVFCKTCYTYGPRVLEYYLQSKDDRWHGVYFKNLQDQKDNTHERYLGGDYFENHTNAAISHD